MGLLDQIGGILKQYESPAAPSSDVSTHFDQVASVVPSGTLADGIAHALRSGQTSGFSQTVSELFGRANPSQKAGMLNQLLSAVTPQSAAMLAGTAVSASGATPEQAQAVSPDVIKQLADHAQSADPAVVDRVSAFYAQHPTLVKGIGATALTLIMSRMSQQHAPNR
ncbi:MAG TPA: hypothetical protein VK679_01265 [Gemmatimonadaceae bacterium]|jgi:hypothetical protein|nr:hypothetical protein [Gemmatimonadaceae bacterium]